MHKDNELYLCTFHFVCLNLCQIYGGSFIFLFYTFVKCYYSSNVYLQ